MPSTVVGALSGGVALLSGNPFSGSIEPYGGIQLYLAKTAPGPVYIGIVRVNMPTSGGGMWSGSVQYLSGAVTITSGGALSSGGGYSDGMELNPDAAYFIPRGPISGRVATAIRIAVPAASSGARLFYEFL